jgi:hypothetical protein
MIQGRHRATLLALGQIFFYFLCCAQAAADDYVCTYGSDRNVVNI